MYAPKDAREVLSRLNHKNRWDASAKFSRRLNSHDRPTRQTHNLLSTNRPDNKFTTTKLP